MQRTHRVSPAHAPASRKRSLGASGLTAALSLSLGLLSGRADAVQKTLKYDQFSEDPNTAVSQIQSTQVDCEPGFYQGEAYGTIFVPDPGDYPFDILSIDLVQADTGDATDTENNVTLRVYVDDGIAAVPSGSPVFEITSGDYFIPPDQFGQPVLESTYMRYQFDPAGEPASHPPKVTSGNVRVMVRFDDPEKDLSEVTPACAFGCQDPCAIGDTAVTPQRNVIQAEGNVWKYAEAFGVKGDWVLRVVIDAANASGSGGSGATTTTTTTTTTTSTTTSSGAGGAGGAAEAECNSDADCPEITQVCRAHKCQDTGSQDEPAAADEGGCGCEVGAAPSGGAALLGLLALGAVARRRPRSMKN